MLVISNTQVTEKPRLQVTGSGVLTLLGAKKKAAEEEEEEEEEQADDWEKSEEEEEWDPDFDEFDVPKSRSGKSEEKDEEDLNFEEEEEFNDLFEDDGFDEDSSGDDY